MDNDEIIKRLQKHYIFFDALKDKIDDKEILENAKKYMEYLFFELIKHNIKSKL